MDSLTLTQTSKPLYQLKTENSHPRTSIKRVVFVKLLRWIDKTAVRNIISTLVRLAALVTVVSTILAQSFVFGIISSHIGFKELLALSVILTYIYWKNLVKFSKRAKFSSSANQYTYHGIPIDEIVSYLFERQSFKDHAREHFGLSFPKHKKIASELESYKVLVRGENNARVLNTITRQELARQLKEDFPLRFHEGEWADKNGSWRTFLKDQEKKEFAEKERVEILNRKEKRLKKKESVLAPLFAQRALECTY